MCTALSRLRALAGQQILDRLQAGVPPSCAGALEVVQAPLHRGTRPCPRPRRTAVLQRARATGRCARLRPLAGPNAQVRVGRLRQAPVRRAGGGRATRCTTGSGHRDRTLAVAPRSPPRNAIDTALSTSACSAQSHSHVAPPNGPRSLSRLPPSGFVQHPPSGRASPPCGRVTGRISDEPTHFLSAANGRLLATQLWQSSSSKSCRSAGAIALAPWSKCGQLSPRREMSVLRQKDVGESCRAESWLGRACLHLHQETP